MNEVTKLKTEDTLAKKKSSHWAQAREKRKMISDSV